MPYEEMVYWFEYFNNRPIGWREDQRTSLLLQAQGVKEKPENIFASLKAIKENRYSSQENQIASSLLSSGLLSKLQTAASANKIDWEISIDKNEITNS